jgi:YbbR domain-containing protein
MGLSLGLPLELHDLPADMELVSMSTERVNVRFTGPRRVVLRISQMGLTLPLDLTGAAEGETTFELYPSDIKAPEKVTVTRISPSSVSVELEQVIKRRMPVRVQIQGAPAKGFVAEKADVQPAAVVIRGPRSVIGAIESVRTAPVSVEGAERNVEGEVGLILAEDTLRIEGRQTVRVTVPISPKGAQ